MVYESYKYDFIQKAYFLIYICHSITKFQNHYDWFEYLYSTHVWCVGRYVIQVLRYLGKVQMKFFLPMLTLERYYWVSPRNIPLCLEYVFAWSGHLFISQFIIIREATGCLSCREAADANSANDVYEMCHDEQYLVTATNEQTPERLCRKCLITFRYFQLARQN